MSSLKRLGTAMMVELDDSETATLIDAVAITCEALVGPTANLDRLAGKLNSLMGPDVVGLRIEVLLAGQDGEA